MCKAFQPFYLRKLYRYSQICLLIWLLLSPTYTFSIEENQKLQQDKSQMQDSQDASQSEFPIILAIDSSFKVTATSIDFPENVKIWGGRSGAPDTNSKWLDLEILLDRITNKFSALQYSDIHIIDESSNVCPALAITCFYEAGEPSFAYFDDLAEPKSKGLFFAGAGNRGYGFFYLYTKDTDVLLGSAGAYNGKFVFGVKNSGEITFSQCGEKVFILFSVPKKSNRFYIRIGKNNPVLLPEKSAKPITNDNLAAKKEEHTISQVTKKKEENIISESIAKQASEPSNAAKDVDIKKTKASTVELIAGCSSCIVVSLLFAGLLYWIFK